MEDLLERKGVCDLENKGLSRQGLTGDPSLFVTLELFDKNASSFAKEGEVALP